MPFKSIIDRICLSIADIRFPAPNPTEVAIAYNELMVLRNRTDEPRTDYSPGIRDALRSWAYSVSVGLQVTRKRAAAVRSMYVRERTRFSGGWPYRFGVQHFEYLINGMDCLVLRSMPEPVRRERAGEVRFGLGGDSFLFWWNGSETPFDLCGLAIYAAADYAGLDKRDIRPVANHLTELIRYGSESVLPSFVIVPDEGERRVLRWREIERENPEPPMRFAVH